MVLFTCKKVSVGCGSFVLLFGILWEMFCILVVFVVVRGILRGC